MSAITRPQPRAAAGTVTYRRPFWLPRRVDALFGALVRGFALLLLALCLAIGAVLLARSRLAMATFGLRFLWSSTWDPIAGVYGALPFIYGTLATSALALLVAVPLSVGAALFLAELAPNWLRAPVSFIIELLAGIPSIVYGLWGMFVLVPVVRPVQLWLSTHLSWVPLFNGTPYGLGIMSAGLVLAIMVVPILTSISREVILAVPRSVRDAAYAVGATHWETIVGPVLQYGRGGLVGAVLIALGRALGETMAVTMVIGNSPQVSWCLFDPGYSMASLLANEFAEASEPLHISVLLLVGFGLFALTIAVNAVARLLLWRLSDSSGAAFRE